MTQYWILYSIQQYTGPLSLMCLNSLFENLVDKKFGGLSKTGLVQACEV